MISKISHWSFCLFVEHLKIHYFLFRNRQKDLLDVYQSKRITIENTPGETTLTISDVTRRDGGMYVCVAKNTLGRNKQTVKLIVSGKGKKKTLNYIV